MKQKVKVWDLPTRLFHWLLVLSVGFMWYSAQAGGGMLVWHLRCGLLVAGLIVFRLCWGLWGSDTARFSQFVRGPSSIRRYLQGSLTENEQPGHNPLGALMVIALIAAVLLQATTGLFAADENTFTDSGYLNHLVSSDTGSLMRKIHVNFFNLLAALAGLHIVTVLAYKFLKKKDLIRPMISGYKHIEGQTVVLKFASSAKLISALAVAAAAVAAILMLK